MTQPAVPVRPEVTSANWRTAQFLQWSFQHSREIVPTARVSRITGAVAEFPDAATPLAAVAVPAAGGPPTTVGAVGVLHRRLHGDP